MRRSDQEFKEELLLRVAEYKVRRRKRRENALKVASVAVMICVLFVSAQWVKVAQEEWYWPTDRPAIDGPVADGTTAASGEIEDMTDVAEETVDYGGDATQSEIEEDVAMTESPTESPAEVVTASKVTIETLGTAFNSTGDGAGYSEYENPTLAGELAKYLSGLMEAATEVPTVEEAETDEELKVDEEAEGGTQSESTSAEGSTVRQRHKFTVQYSDGTEVSYIVKQGDGELLLDEEGCLILDQESWDRLSQIMREYR